MQKQSYYRGPQDAKKVEAWSTALRENSFHWNAFDVEHSAILIIDMQNYFLDPSSHAFVESGRAILPNILDLVGHFRGHGRPVIFTYFAVQEGEDDPILRWWGESVPDGSAESLLTSELVPQEGELLLRKSSYSSFQGTELEEYLRKKEVQSLVVTGVLTNLCCETAAREAFCLGFDVFVPADALATYTEEMHLLSLQNLSYGFATPLCTSDMLGA